MTSHPPTCSSITTVSSDTAQAPQRRGRGRGARVGPAIALAFAVCLGVLDTLAGPNTAEAVGVSGVSGRPGAVTVQGPQILATDFDTTVWYNFGGTMVPYPVSNRQFTANGATVGRSTATGASQTVAMTYYLRKWNGSNWVSINQTDTMFGTLAGGTTSWRFGTWNVLPAQSAGTYRMVHFVAWIDTSSGAVLGSEIVFPNRAGETQCATRRLRCTPYTDSVVIG